MPRGRVGGGPAARLRWRTALRLGRVSNLPTVWTDTLAGWVLAGGYPGWRVVPVMIAMTLFYVGGMYLNDAFDWRIDARERPSRPIPSGAASARAVFTAGFTLLGAGLALLAATGGKSWHPALAGLALGAAILYYDARHKRDPLSPLWMGLCRLLVYVGAGLVAIEQPQGRLYASAAVALCYLIGLTYIAKQETLTRVTNLWPLLFLAAPLAYGSALAGRDAYSWAALTVFAAWGTYALRFLWRRRAGDIPRSVVSLIAGICLLDGVFLALCGEPGLAALAAAGFAATLGLQRYIPGT